MREGVLDDRPVAHVGEEGIERSRIARSAIRSAARPAGVMVSRIARRSPSTDVRSTSPLATSVSTAAETVGRARRELPGEAARAFLAADDEGEEPVLGERQVGARPLEGSGDPHQGDDLPVVAFFGRAHAESIANYSGN